MPRYCQSCVLPDTRPGVRLDDDGVCQGCKNVDAKKGIDWEARAGAFAQVAEEARKQNRKYDCVIPVSGGKDGFWQVQTALEHGLHPLCVTYHVPFRNELGERNLQKLVDLGVDHIDFRPNPAVERTFIRKAFATKAISGLVPHMAIFALPVQVAVAYDIPLVIYAENSAMEYGTEDDSLTGARLDHRWLMRFGVTDGTTAEDWIDDELTRQGLGPYFFPSDAELEARNIKVVFLGYYYPWDPENSKRIAEQYGFESRKEGPLVGHYSYANIDDELLGIHQHAKWYKFGITRSWDTISMEIRNGRVTRDEAIALLRDSGAEIPWHAIELFCNYLGLSQAEYFSILEKFRNPEIWSRRDGKWIIEDFLIDPFDWPEDAETS
ncbi:MAG: N-acetyl sugar amidotransferase [Gammaproteobacteria bacterium]